ncbi:MAG: M12 family metallo-peptidase [Kiritimatiellales bacterium]
MPVALIRGGEETDVQWTSRTPAAKRVRKIFPDPSWMTPDPVLKAGDRIELVLFDDAIFDAQISNVTRYPNGGVGMTAHLSNGMGTVYLSYCDGALRASVEVMGGADYAIYYKPEQNTHYAIEVDSANTIVLEGAEPRFPDVTADLLPGADAVASGDIVEDAPSGSTIIDVMVVYTPAALSYEGSEANMNDNIALAMQKANETHTNSDTQVYLNLVHSTEVDYYESGTNFSLDLDYLTDIGDGYLEEVQVLRDTYKADLVCLFESNSVSGGLGWLLTTTSGNQSHAFCLARVQQTSWTYTMVHEWGHNMGCSHSKTQTAEPWTGKLYSYSAGWQWEDTMSPATIGYCSVMTYENFDDDLENGYEYKRVGYFSNPANYYVGNSTNATGDVSNGNNALTIRNMKTVLANYRKAPDVDYDGLPNEWELLYFGGETNANPVATASNGVNTVLDTYIAGISPVDPAAFFKINSFQTPVAASNGFVVGWDATNGRIYSVYRATNLLSSTNFQPLATNIVWPQSSYTDTVHAAESRSFYKINVQLAP